MAKILVLEKNEDFRRVLVKALEDEGYSVTGCCSDGEAVEKARLEEFTLIVAGVETKGLDGLGAVPLIQSLQPEMRSLVVTDFADTIETARAETIYLDGFLEKPLDLDSLLDQVELLVQRRAAAGVEIRAEAERLEWARWVNEREGERLDLPSTLSSRELTRIAREVCSRVGLGGFEGEQVLSALFWLADSSQGKKACPKALKRFVGEESRGLVGKVCWALGSLIGRVPPYSVPDYLLSLVNELKEREPWELDRSERALLESARQEGPLALSEAAVAIGLFLLQKGQSADAIAHYAAAGRACEGLGLKLEAKVCQLVHDLLIAPRLSNPLRDRIATLNQPQYQAIVRAFRPTFDLVFARWGSTLDAALREAGERESVTLKPQVELFSLGRFKVTFNGREIPNGWWRSKKARQLFCYLAMESGRLSEEGLIDQFWPGDPTKGRNNLYAATSYIRGAFRKGGMETDPLERSNGTLELSSEIHVWHDCQQVLAAREAETIAERRCALSLYNGTFLPDCYMDWAELIKRMVDEAVLEMSLDLAQRALQDGRFSEAVESGRTALSVSPCLDVAHLIIMESLLEQSRFLEVLRHYESCKQVYRLELEASPPVDVERLYQQARLSL